MATGASQSKRYFRFDRVRMQRGNRSSHSLKDSRNRIQCALSSETQCRRYRFSLYFYFGRSTSVCHYYLLTVFLAYSKVFFPLFFVSYSLIRSFVRSLARFNLLVVTFSGIARRTNSPFLFCFVSTSFVVIVGSLLRAFTSH